MSTSSRPVLAIQSIRPMGREALVIGNPDFSLTPLDPAQIPPAMECRLVRKIPFTKLEAQMVAEKTGAVPLMRRAAEDGFWGINIECFNPAVNHVWSEPPSPFKGSVVSSVDTNVFEVTNEKGEKVKPLVHANTLVTKVFVTLK